MSISLVKSAVPRGIAACEHEAQASPRRDSGVIDYETGFGKASLVWRRRLLISHRLPGSLLTGGHVSGNDENRGGSGHVPARASAQLIEQLQSYFAGGREELNPFDLPLDLSDYSRFELDVIGALASVPFGATVSYAELARLAGHPRAYRAAGSVMARNPYPVILPCHRVIRSDGKTGGFSGGKGWKQKLLALEGSANRPKSCKL